MTDDNTSTTAPTGGNVRQNRPPARPGDVVDKRIRAWQHALRHANPRQRAHSEAVLARLRQGVGKPAGSVPDIVGFTSADEFITEPTTDRPTPAETAAHVAITLYAVHQQSHDTPMHQRGHGLGRAIRRLHPDEPTSPTAPVVRQFQALVAAETLDELVHHAHDMIRLLSAAEPAGIPLDYGRLTDQLLRWQTPDGPAEVRTVWTQEFHRTQGSGNASPSDSATDAAATSSPSEEN